MDIVKDIESYIHFLQDNFRLSVSLHPTSTRASLNASLMMFGLHCNPYCMYLKSNDTLWRTCIARQKKVRHRAEQGSWFGMCHAGVYEYVYPYPLQGEVAGFLCVSGYRIDNKNSRTAKKRICEQFDLSEESLEQCYHSLNDVIPPKQFIDTLLHPLCHMLELYCAQYFALNAKEGDFYNELYHYINRYHNTKLTIDDLCRHFHRSRSAISHTFKANNGMSISCYINKLRLDDAKALLRGTRLSVTSVSALVGFSDANYFSNVFKTAFGISPLQYRKQLRLS